MFHHIKEDFKQEIKHSTYPKGWKQGYHAITSPGFQAIVAFRLTHKLYQLKVPFLGSVIQRLTEVWSGISISPKARIGPGLVIFHFGGVIINGDVEIGENCILHHDVTIGNRVPQGKCPVIRNYAMIGAGAKIIGDVCVGRHAEVGANAVVLKDVPDYGVAVGVPAKTIRIKDGE